MKATDHFGFFVTDGTKLRGFAWAWRERTDPKKAKAENPGVLAVRVAGKDAKERLLASDAAKFFTEPHYNRFPAVLVRLNAIDADELQERMVPRGVRRREESALLLAAYTGAAA